MKMRSLLLSAFVFFSITLSVGNFTLVHFATEPNISYKQNGEIFSTVGRDFDMGCMPIPRQPIDKWAWFNVFELLGRTAEFVLHQGGMDQHEWEVFSQGLSNETTSSIEVANFIYGMAERYDLQVLRMIDVMEVESDDIANLPPAFESNFGDPNVRTAFKNFAMRHAQYEPPYMALFGEVNGYIKKHPEDTENVLSLFNETYDLVKDISPNTKITVTFQYEALIGLLGGTAQWEILDMFIDKVDVIAITTYPSHWFVSPIEMPEDYYIQLEEHTNKPIIVAESGWPSGGNPLYHGSLMNQNRFLKRFVELTADIDLKLWIYWFLHDWEDIPDFFRTMGLRTTRGIPKPAWFTWSQISTSSYSNRMPYLNSILSRCLENRLFNGDN